MKIVILDAYATNPGDLSWDWLSEYGEVTVFDRTPPELTVKRAREADIVISNKTLLTKDVISKLNNVKFIQLLSTGSNVADVEYARSLNIPVFNIPAYSTTAVAQHTFALILELYNNVGLHNSSVKNYEWSNCDDFCYWKAPIYELAGKTIGLIGFGKIGKTVAKIADAFDMNVIAYKPSAKGIDDIDGYKMFNLYKLLSCSDIVSLHCPQTPETIKMVNSEFLSKMKKNAILINTSRGAVIDEDALANALNNGEIMGAGVDVLSSEPPSEENPLIHCQNCIITPHVAWAGFETRSRLMEICKANFKAYFNGSPINMVN